MAVLVSLASFGLLVSSPAGAAAQSPPMLLAQSTGGMSLEQAVRSVRQQYGGRIVSAHTEVRNGREIHVVKVLTEKGRVRTVRVPGRQLSRN